MSEFDIIHAGKGLEYPESLTEENRSQLPESLFGMVDLSNDEMEQIQGGWTCTTIEQKKKALSKKLRKKKCYK